MKANFQLLGEPGPDTEFDVDSYAQHLAADYSTSFAWFDDKRERPMGYESYRCVDLLGSEFAWVNENFPREQYTWYLWFESIFLVPPEMATFLQLRWS